MSPSDTAPYPETLTAFFHDREDAYDAISELERTGFTQNEIGLAIQGEADVTGPVEVPQRTAQSTWLKIKGFFSGQPEMYDASDYENFFGHLNLSNERSMYYRFGLGRGGAVVTVSTSGARQQEARTILMHFDADLRTGGFERVEPSEMPERRVQLRGELLRTIKDRIESGEIRLRREVANLRDEISQKRKPAA
jgi:hypothetical protein